MARDPESGEPDRVATGELGESIAARWLWARGMKVIYRNYRAPRGGEIDIVLRDGEVLVFCEVKTRTSLAWGRPAAAVDADKQALIARGAMSWLRLLGQPDVHFRFDIVEVVLADGAPPAVNHLREAFELPEPYIYG